MSSETKNTLSVSNAQESSSDSYVQTLGFNGIAIQLKSNHSFTEKAFEGLQDTVTGMQVAPQSESIDGYMEYADTEDIDIKYDESRSQLNISGPARMFGNGTALAFTAHYMAECLRSKKSDSLLVHSAAVKLPDQEASYLILGEKGAGKTTLALRLCHQYGYKLIGNDQVFIAVDEENKLATDTGNAWFNVRETALLADTYLANLLGMPVDHAKPSWNNKINVSPESIGIVVCKDRLPIKDIFHVRIDHTQSDLQTMTWRGLQRNLVLHERLGRHITGQATPFQDDYGNYIGSLPPINLARSLKVRDKLVGLVIQKGLTEIFSPNSNDAVEYITQKEQV